MSSPIRNTKHFAPVVPLSIAACLKENNLLGNYHLLLAHDVLANPDAYKEIYRPYTDGRPMDIIMDNSLIELGYPMEVLHVLEAAKVVGAKKVVLPDELGELDKTLRAVWDSVDVWHKLPMEVTKGIKPVAVVQGKNLSECLTCIREYAKSGIEDISIPRVLQKYLGSRSEITMIAHLHYGFQNIHLLGFSDNILDDVACTRQPGVKGIDSAVPIRAAYKTLAISMDDPHFDRLVGPRGTYWDVTPKDLSAVQISMIMHNIRTFQGWINQ